MSDCNQARLYQAFINSVNREPPDDEYAALAAYDALTAEYNLDRYLTPPIEIRRERIGSNAARLGGVFTSLEGREQPCRV